MLLKPRGVFNMKVQTSGDGYLGQNKVIKNKANKIKSIPH